MTAKRGQRVSFAKKDRVGSRRGWRDLAFVDLRKAASRCNRQAEETSALQKFPIRRKNPEVSRRAASREKVKTATM